MKKIAKTIGGCLFGFTFLFSSCSDMLKTDSDMLLFSDDHRLDSANDSLYSVVGILNQLKELGDRYVILGELRGELMDVTEKSSIDLQEINQFSISAENPYVTTREYYEVINNCNYFIRHANPDMEVNGKKVFLSEIAAVKAIRAWIYMQLALNYGKAIYYEDPILTVDDSNKDYPQLDLAGIAEKLIADLSPFVGVELPQYGNFGDFNSQYLFLPVEALLGDLYLWTNRYQEAANHYYYLIFRKSYTVRSTYSSYWLNTGFTTRLISWPGLFSNLTNEAISVIRSVSEYGGVSRLSYQTDYSDLDLGDSDYYSLIPSESAIDLWDNEVYAYFDNTPTSPTYQYVLTTKGDLRGRQSSYSKYPIASSSSASGDSITLINKYRVGYGTTETSTGMIATNVFLLRTASLYLRYAEAINQTGRPTLALAVLKNGLKEETLENREIIHLNEITPLAPYCDFTAPRFSGNVGIRSRGLGDAEYDSTYCAIPLLPHKEDSIAYVDDLICKEYALETAFEGNRFHDLMRFAFRRNDPAYLAQKVSSKHPDNPAIYDKLLNTNNWYLPLDKR